MTLTHTAELQKCRIAAAGTHRRRVVFPGGPAQLLAAGDDLGDLSPLDRLELALGHAIPEEDDPLRFHLGRFIVEIDKQPPHGRLEVLQTKGRRDPSSLQVIPGRPGGAFDHFHSSQVKLCQSQVRPPLPPPLLCRAEHASTLSRVKQWPKGGDRRDMGGAHQGHMQLTWITSMLWPCSWMKAEYWVAWRSRLPTSAAMLGSDSCHVIEWLTSAPGNSSRRSQAHQSGSQWEEEGADWRGWGAAFKSLLGAFDSSCSEGLVRSGLQISAEPHTNISSWEQY